MASSQPTPASISRQIKYAPAKIPLNIIVVGAGIGGLAAALALGARGHSVTILEAAPAIGEVGAGIQVAPNMLRLLDRWGVGDIVRQKGVALDDIHIQRYEGQTILGKVPISRTHGEQLVVHRADLHMGLLKKVEELGADRARVRVNSKVVDVDFATGEVKLEDGTVLTSDVVLAADGIKSGIRTKLLGDEKDVAIPTGDACFRVTLTREEMSADEELKPFIMEKKAVRWVGPDRHIIAYPVRSHEIYNMALAHPDRGRVDEDWTTVTSKSNLLNEYKGWDPRLVKMLNMVPEGKVLEWKICWHQPLIRWVQDKCALMGDACHPMPPYVAQGAAQAVEDAASLGVTLSSISNKEEVPMALQAFQNSQKARAEYVQQSTFTTRAALHLHDGPEQVARDQKFMSLSEGKENPDQWGDPEMQRFLWGWDAEVKAAESWKTLKSGDSLPKARL